MASEMEVARSVQQAQLASEIPTLDGVEIAVLYKPAREVGGDAYDFCPVEADRVGIIVSDVAGKGVPAALLLASARYAWREHCQGDPAQTMREVNNHLQAMTTEDAFVVMRLRRSGHPQARVHLRQRRTDAADCGQTQRRNHLPRRR